MWLQVSLYYVDNEDLLESCKLQHVAPMLTSLDCNASISMATSMPKCLTNVSLREGVAIPWDVLKACKLLQSIEADANPFPVSWMEGSSPVWPHLGVVKWHIRRNQSQVEEFLENVGKRVRTILDTGGCWQPEKITKLFGLCTQIGCSDGAWPWKSVEVEEVKVEVVGGDMLLDEADLFSSGVQHLQLDLHLSRGLRYSGTFHFAVQPACQTVTWAAPGPRAPRCPAVFCDGMISS